MRACTCSEQQVHKYQARISVPMLDRFDIQLDVQRVDFEKLTDDRRGESSAAVPARVESARDYLLPRVRLSVLNTLPRLSSIVLACCFPDNRNLEIRSTPDKRFSVYLGQKSSGFR